MNLTNEQKRKILSDAPMGAEYYSEVGGGTYLMRSMALPVSIVFAYRADGWKQALDKLSDWDAIKLVDLQGEVDAEGEMLLIVAAVNGMRGEFNHGGLDGERGSQAIMALLDFDGLSNGDVVSGNSVRNNKYWQVLCTIDEFNQCAKELSEAAWMNDDEPQYYDIYKLAYRDMQETEKRRVLAGSEWQNGDECVFDSRSGMFIGLSKDRKLAIVETNNEHLYDIAYVLIGDLEKPQTAEQKADKELNEKAAELYKARCDAFGYTFDWDALAGGKKQGYRNMIKAGVVMNEKAAK